MPGGSRSDNAQTSSAKGGLPRYSIQPYCKHACIYAGVLEQPLLACVSLVSSLAQLPTRACCVYVQLYVSAKTYRSCPSPRSVYSAQSTPATSPGPSPGERLLVSAGRARGATADGVVVARRRRSRGRRWVAADADGPGRGSFSFGPAAGSAPPPALRHSGEGTESLLDFLLQNGDSDDDDGTP
jgi:hypothetical protein